MLGCEQLPITSKYGTAYLHGDGDTILKVNGANSLGRAIRDYTAWLNLARSFGHPGLIQNSMVGLSEAEGKTQTVISQKFISPTEGAILGKFSETDLIYFLRKFPSQKRLLTEVIRQFYFLRIEQRRLFADLVGEVAPIFESQNLMLLDYDHPKETPHLRVVDTGLSPHEKTLKEFGNVQRFLQNPVFQKERKLMAESLVWLHSI